MDNTVRILVTIRWDESQVRESINEEAIFKTINEALSSFEEQRNPNFKAVLFNEFMEKEVKEAVRALYRHEKKWRNISFPLSKAFLEADQAITEKIENDPIFKLALELYQIVKGNEDVLS